MESQDPRNVPSNDVIVPTFNEFIAGVCKMEARSFPTRQVAKLQQCLLEAISDAPLSEQGRESQRVTSLKQQHLVLHEAIP